MPGKIISALFGIFFAIAGPLAIAYGGFWWAMDRPAWHAPWPVSFIGWSAGAHGQIAQIRGEEAKWIAAFDTERGSVVTLTSAIDMQNASIAKAASDSLAWQARSSNAVVQAQRSNAWRLTLAQQIAGTKEPAGETYDQACHAAEAVLREGGQ